MIRLKSAQDIILIKKAIVIGNKALKYATKITEVGITTKEIDLKVEEFISKYKSIPSFKGYEGFPASCCISINEQIIHGVPSERRIENGDVVKIDVGVCYKNRYSDQAITIIIGKVKSKEHTKLIKATKLALVRAQKVAIVGNKIGNISYEIERTAKENDLGIVYEYAGHGVGFGVHEDPLVPNVSNKTNDFELIPGLIIAIEPMFTLGKGKLIKTNNGVVTEDGSVGAHFEQTIII